MPPSVTFLGDGAFKDCVNLINATISSSVKSIGGNTFRGCKSLTSITIPSSVTIIEQGAFTDCESLTSVTLSRWTQFGEDVFPDSARIIYHD
jgi:hypothetical protein